MRAVRPAPVVQLSARVVRALVHSCLHVRIYLSSCGGWVVGRERFVAVAVLTSRENDAGLAAEFLRRAARRRVQCGREDQKPLGAACRHIVSGRGRKPPRCLGCSFAGIDRRPGCEPRRTLVEAHVTDGVRKQSTAKGLAPPSSPVYQQLASGSQMLPEVGTPALQHAPAHRPGTNG